MKGSGSSALHSLRWKTPMQLNSFPAMADKKQYYKDLRRQYPTSCHVTQTSTEQYRRSMKPRLKILITNMLINTIHECLFILSHCTVCTLFLGTKLLCEPNCSVCSKGRHILYAISWPANYTVCCNSHSVSWLIVRQLTDQRMSSWLYANTVLVTACIDCKVVTVWEYIVSPCLDAL